MMTGNKARNKIRGMRAFIIRENLGRMGCAALWSVAWGGGGTGAPPFLNVLFLWGLVQL
jgi:hypothetical protein